MISPIFKYICWLFTILPAFGINKNLRDKPDSYRMYKYLLPPILQVIRKLKTSGIRLGFLTLHGCKTVPDFHRILHKSLSTLSSLWNYSKQRLFRCYYIIIRHILFANYFTFSFPLMVILFSLFLNFHLGCQGTINPCRDSDRFLPTGKVSPMSKRHPEGQQRIHYHHTKAGKTS